MKNKLDVLNMLQNHDDCFDEDNGDDEMNCRLEYLTSRAFEYLDKSIDVHELSFSMKSLVSRVLKHDNKNYYEACKNQNNIIDNLKYIRNVFKRFNGFDFERKIEKYDEIFCDTEIEDSLKYLQTKLNYDCTNIELFIDYIYKYCQLISDLKKAI